MVVSHAALCDSRICIITVREKPNVKAIKMDNFTLDQIIGFLHYIAGKEEEMKFRIKCFHIAKNAARVLGNM